VTEQPPVRRRLLGGALRRYRENLGLTIEDAAKALECDRSKISRIETGHRGIRAKELRELLTEYGVPQDDQHALDGLARRARHGGWWEEFAEVVPDTAVDYLIMEAAAAEIMIYDPHVPDLLQTPDYARAVTAARPGTVTDDQLGQAATALATRQQAVLGGSTRLAVVIGEAALRQETGEPAVLAAQLRQLIELASDHPGVTLQVVPFTAGAHAALPGGAHTILRFTPGIGVVYLPALTGGAYLTSQADLAAYTSAFALLRATALSPAETTRLLRQALDDRPPWE
jgi:transcriptional regulator with XRE-family HTH domain